MTPSSTAPSRRRRRWEKALLLFVGAPWLVRADYETDCHRQAGIKRSLLHPGAICERYLRLKPDPHMGEACVFGANGASQDASFKLCSAMDWIIVEGSDSGSRSKGAVAGVTSLVVNSTHHCLAVDSLLEPPYTSVLVETMRRSCRAGYLEGYRRTWEALRDHLSETEYKDIMDQVHITPTTIIDWAPEPVMKEVGITPEAPEEVELEMATDLDLIPYLSVKVHNGQPVRVPVPPDVPVEQAVVNYCRDHLKAMGSLCPRQIMHYIQMHGVEATSTTGAAIYHAGIGSP